MKLRAGFAFAAAVATALSLSVTSASAQQSGLVNVAVVNNTVQIPIGVAANVCGVAVNVLASQIANGETACTAVAGATATRSGGRGGSSASQHGLVNLFVADNTVHVPVGIAANVCGVSANVLTSLIANGGATCDALGNATATG
jgi:hypothetical protein